MTIYIECGDSPRIDEKLPIPPDWQSTIWGNHGGPADHQLFTSDFRTERANSDIPKMIYLPPRSHRRVWSCLFGRSCNYMTVVWRSILKVLFG